VLRAATGSDHSMSLDTCSNHLRLIGAETKKPPVSGPEVPFDSQILRAGKSCSSAAKRMNTDALLHPGEQEKTGGEAALEKPSPPALPCPKLRGQLDTASSAMKNPVTSSIEHVSWLIVKY
jgi:hypothetical protein